MWAYEFVKKDTRYKVLTLKTFMKQNHDLPKLWYEEEHIPKEIRTNFYLRFWKFFTLINFLVIFVYTLIDFQDDYYQGMWDRRKTCLNYWDQDYFPVLTWKELTNITLTYNGANYNKFFIYQPPSNNTNYLTWKGYRNDNPNFEYISYLNRQERLHTWFDYCRSTTDANFTTDTRPQWSSISNASQSNLLCVLPETDWEFTTLSSEYTLYGSGMSAISFSPLVSILAVLIVFPVYFTFEILCIILSRVKGDIVNSLRDTVLYKRWFVFKMQL